MKKALMLCLTGVFAFLTGCGGGSDPSFSLGSKGDGFQQVNSTNTKIDILWVIDNSGSMNASQQDLKDNFSLFIADFVSKGYDFQMAITTSEGYRTEVGKSVGGSVGTQCQFIDHDDEDTDGSTTDIIIRDCRRLIGGIINPSTPDLENYFKQRITVGTFGSGDERMIQSAQSVLDYPENSSFIREDSHLAVILVSDEEDFSGSPGGGSNRDNTDLFSLTPGEQNTSGVNYSTYNASIDSWETYFDNLTGTTSEVKNYSVSSIGIFDFDPAQITANGLNYVSGYNPDTFYTFGSYDPSHATSVDHTDCQKELKTIYNSTQQPSLRMGRLTDATGGVKSSLCGDFGQGLIDIANNIITLVTDYPLNSTPLPETIVVTIDGVEVAEADLGLPSPDGWGYNASTNSISFYGTAIPPQGSNIIVTYTPNGL